MSLDGSLWEYKAGDLPWVADGALVTAETLAWHALGDLEAGTWDTLHVVRSDLLPAGIQAPTAPVVRC